MNTEAVVEKQRNFFKTGKTLNVSFRLRMLERLQKAIIAMENEIHKAIRMDLGKSSFEAYMCETGMVLSEISYMKKHLRQFAAPKLKWTPLAQFPSFSRILMEPYGCVLIMSPWNYPFMLAIEPLVDALAAGNTAVVKPSAYSPATSVVIKKLLAKCFPQEYVAVVEGGRMANEDLLDREFDYIFFTGGTDVGRLVMKKAAEHFTPVTLEMGGKSPCIVDETANLKIAARRIVFGKFLNCGQTCVAPDYLLVADKVKEKLLSYIAAEIERMYGRCVFENEKYGRIINEKHFIRLRGLLAGQEIYCGGGYRSENLQIEPTVLNNVSPDSAVMREEIFGPILPVISYKTMAEAINFVRSRPKPLALYFFSTNKRNVRCVEKYLSYGGGCINDTIIHLATSELPFSGVGRSGMGEYHGRHGFETFSHKKGIVSKSNLIDLPIRYQPYNEVKRALLKLFLR